MINQNQLQQLSYFYPYFGLEPFFWPQFTHKMEDNYQIVKQEIPDSNSYKVISTKVEQKQQIDTLRTHKNSSQFEHQHIVKKQKESNSDNFFTFKFEANEDQRQENVNYSKRNETKNISKNFGKAILSFAKSNTNFVKKLFIKYGVDKQTLITYIKKARKNLNSLQDLREMWGADDEKDNMKKCLRILSHYFMRKYCLRYIYNSRIRSVSAHTKYRHRLMEGMSKPSQFTNIKVN